MGMTWEVGYKWDRYIGSHSLWQTVFGKTDQTNIVNYKYALYTNLYIRDGIYQHGGSYLSQTLCLRRI